MCDWRGRWDGRFAGAFLGVGMGAALDPFWVSAAGELAWNYVGHESLKGQ